MSGWTESHLAANAEVAVRDELGLLVAVLLLLQERVEHAHGHAGQGQHEGQDLPRLGWKRGGLVHGTGIKLPGAETLRTDHF